MLLLNEACDMQIGSWIANCLPLKSQTVGLVQLFELFSEQPTGRKPVNNYLDLSTVLISKWVSHVLNVKENSRLKRLVKNYF